MSGFTPENNLIINAVTMAMHKAAIQTCRDQIVSGHLDGTDTNATMLLAAVRLISANVAHLFNTSDIDRETTIKILLANIMSRIAVDALSGDDNSVKLVGTAAHNAVPMVTVK